MCQKTLKIKLKKLEEIVEEDCANGRHLKKKMDKNIIKNGQSKEKFIEDMKKIKANI